MAAKVTIPDRLRANGRVKMKALPDPRRLSAHRAQLAEWKQRSAIGTTAGAAAVTKAGGDAARSTPICRRAEEIRGGLEGRCSLHLAAFAGGK